MKKLLPDTMTIHENILSTGQQSAIRMYFLFILFFVTLSGHAQTDKYSLRLAEAYEKDGRFEEAVTIYEKLYLSDSTNPAIIRGLKNGYKILNRQDERLRILERQWRIDTTQTDLLYEFTDAYYRKKDLSSAREMIRRIIAANAASEISYQRVGRMLFELRWYDEALKIYQQGRTATKNERLFLAETAEIHVLLGQYSNAVEDYLRLYRFYPGQWNFVRNRLTLLPEDTSTHRQLMQVVQREVRRYPDDIQLLRYLQEVAIRSKDYDGAYQVALLIDQKEKQNGLSLLQFAQSVFPHGQYRLAARAYHDFLKLYPNAPQAEMGLAGVWLAIADSVKSRSPFTSDTSIIRIEMFWIQEAENQYREIIRKYPRTEWEVEARYHTGLIYLNRMMDYDRAFSEFETIVRQYQNSAWYPSALIQKIECLLRQNKLAEALGFCTQYRKHIRDPILAEQILFLSGELYLFHDQIDSAYSIFRVLSQNAQGFYVNDALRYILLIEEKKSAPDSFQKFILARQLHRRLRYHEAIKLLLNVVEKTAGLEDVIQFELAMLFAKTGQYDEAVNRWLAFPEKMPDSPLTDRALLSAADLYFQTGEEEKAARVYKQLISRYPKSIYVQDARKKIRYIENIKR